MACFFLLAGALWTVRQLLGVPAPFAGGALTGRVRRDAGVAYPYYPAQQSVFRSVYRTLDGPYWSSW